MKDLSEVCDLYLVGEGKVVTRVRMNHPQDVLIRQVISGKRCFIQYRAGQKLKAVLREGKVWVWPAEQASPLESQDSRCISETEIVAHQENRNLTSRQYQVLDGLVSGQTLAEIAHRLGIRTRSVRHHVDALKSRLGAVSLSQLVARALSAGLITSTPPQGGPGAGQRSDHPKKH